MSAARRVALAACVLALAACANQAYLEGRDLLAAGRVDEGLAKLDQAMREEPGRREYRAAYMRERELALARALAEAEAARAAGEFEIAGAAFQRALAIDGNNERARAGQSTLASARRLAAAVRQGEEFLRARDFVRAEGQARAVLAESSQHAQARALMRRIEEQRGPDLQFGGVNSPFTRPVTLEFRDAPLRGVFETMSRVAGINFVFDRDVRQDLRVTIFVRSTSIDEVMRLILSTNGLERKLLNENSVLIYPNTPAKQREFQELAVRTFYLTHADTKQAQTLIRALAKTRDLYADEKLNAIIVRDTPDAIRLVEKLIASIDLPEPEVMLEIEVMEIASSRVQEIGVRWPSQAQFGDIGTIRDTLSATTTGGATVTQQATTTVAPPRLQINRSSVAGNAIWSVTNPVAVANLRADVSGTNTLANPRIRVRNREKAKVHIGDKLPVFTTTSTANVGVSASVSYLDVGLKLDIEPVVSLDNEVSMKVGLEVSSVTKEIAGPAGSIAYQVGTRLTNTVLRLKDGETQILAGLINDEDRSSASRIPGLGDIPILGRLFGSQQDTRNKSEIVLLITPRVLRNLVPPALLSATIAAGTEAQVGVAPMRLANTAPRALGLSSSGPGGAAQPPPPPAEPPSVVVPPPGVFALPGSVVAGAAPVALSLAASGDAQSGQIVVVSVTSAVTSPPRGMRVELAFDPTVLEPVGISAESPGRVILPIVPPAAAAVARFRVAGAPGSSATVAISGVRFTDGGSTEFSTTLPVVVQVRP